MKLNKFLITVTLSLFVLGLGTQEAHGMHSAKKLFHATCTGLSYAIQGTTTCAGTIALMQAAKAKYGNDEELAKKQALAYEVALEPHLIGQALSERGKRKFDDPHHYDPVFVLPSFDVGDAAVYNTNIGRHGTILYDATSRAILTHFDKNEDRVACIKAIANHEAQHIDNNDAAKYCTLAVVLPFVTGLATNKIQAPIKAFAQARKWVSNEPSCLKSIAKIPSALAKACITRSALNAYSISMERNADASIPDDKEQLDAWEKLFSHADKELANVSYLNKLIYRFGGLRLLPNVHPPHAERAETACRRIEALDAAKKSA